MFKELKATRTDQGDAFFSHRITILVAGTLAFHTVLRGFITLNGYPASQFLLNYDFGFCKRALLGELIRKIDQAILYDYSFFFWFSVGIFLLVITLLFQHVRKLTQSQSAPLQGAALVFCSSLGIAQLSSSIGYPDLIILLVSLAILRVERFFVRQALIATLFAATLLIHEAGVLLYFPVLMFRSLLDLSRLKIRPYHIACFCIVCLEIILIEFILSTSPLSTESALSLYHELKAKADYPVWMAVVWPLHLSAYENTHVMKFFLSLEGFKRSILISTVCTAPTLAYLNYQSDCLLKHAHQSRTLRLAALSAGLLPLSMHFIGLDFWRWNAAATMASLLVLSTVFSSQSQVSTANWRTDKSVYLAAILVLSNLAVSIPLENSSAARLPYPRLLSHTAKVFDGELPFPEKPEPLTFGSCKAVAKLQDIVDPRLIECTED